MMKRVKILSAVLAASLLLGGCRQASGDRPLKNDPQAKTEIDLDEVWDTDFDSKLMDKEYRRYCFELFSQTVKDTKTEENIMISPASIMMALDMVAAGAKEETLRQLTDLFAKGQAPLTQQAYAAQLMDSINVSRSVDFSCANAVWANEDILGNKVNQDYVEYIEEAFVADYRVSKFSKKTVNEINDWVDDHTDHMIRKIVNNLDPDTAMVLVNAIAFDAKWAEPYKEHQIEEGDFTAYDGNIQNATFLNWKTGLYFENDKATGFIKGYKGGDYYFIVMLPKDESVSANEFIKDFTPDDYEEFIHSITSDFDVYTKLPEFKYDFEYSVNDTIKNLGAGDVFDPLTADLSGISGKPGDLYVSQVIHKTHIELDRNGTKASAATSAMVAAGASMQERETREVFCDRPFAYAIVDKNMAPIFIGTVNEL